MISDIFTLNKHREIFNFHSVRKRRKVQLPFLKTQ